VAYGQAPTPEKAAQDLSQTQSAVPKGWKAETKRVKVATPRGDEEREIVYFTNTLGMKFALIPAGTFMMGDTLSPEEMDRKWLGEGGEWYKDAHPSHRVNITRRFHMGAQDVTRGQFAQFVRESDYRSDAEKEGLTFALKDGEWGIQEGVSWRNPLFEQTDDHPVVCVSWNDATAFCKWLSEKEDKEYRLPTEAEWEYAARAGSNTTWYWGNDEFGAQGRAKVAGEGQGWKYFFKGVHYADRFTAAVGSLTPNAFGLYDLIGNVWNWCTDWYDANYYGSSPTDDPVGPDSGQLRVVRGGSWRDAPWDARSANRGRSAPELRSTNSGFRVVCLSR
jgi:formylglycine-generating enzyme required for sulfatase activity